MVQDKSNNTIFTSSIQDMVQEVYIDPNIKYILEVMGIAS